MKRRHFTNFDIAGFTYWDGALVFQELSIGTELYLTHVQCDLILRKRHKASY